MGDVGKVRMVVGRRNDALGVWRVDLMDEEAGDLAWSVPGGALEQLLYPLMLIMVVLAV